MNRIKELRLRNNWTQKNLAQMLNTKSQTISRYETGERGLDMETVFKLCDVFSCTSDYLLGRSSVGGINLTEYEERLIIAHRRADQRSREVVRLTLEPFTEERERSAETEKSSA